VLDVLQNMRDRVESKAALDDAEAESAGAALTRVIEVVGPNAGAALAEGLAAAPATPPAARAATLRALLSRAFDVLDGLPEPVATPARAALSAHLAAQAMRDIAHLKPSLLQEISKG
jgi:hypothetical protein